MREIICPHCNKGIAISVIGVTEPEKAVKRFVPPTIQEVRVYADTIGFPIDADNFVDFYTMKAWMVGKSKMKDWKAAVRTWFKSYKERNPDFVAPKAITESEAEGLLKDVYV